MSKCKLKSKTYYKPAYYISLGMLLVMVHINLMANNKAFVHFPEISPDGSKLAFCFQGDIWQMNLENGVSNRLTIHEGYDSDPRWSPDGRKLAFTSNRMGNNDVFVISEENHFPKRITYHSSNDDVTGWLDNQTILFSTARNYKQVEWDPEIQIVQASGGTPERLLNSLGYDATTSPDGKFTAFTFGSCRISREEYQGSANRNIWIYDHKNKHYTQLTDFVGNDFLPKWGSNGSLFFLSARNGRYNVYNLIIDENGNKKAGEKAVTQYTKMGITHFSVDRAGKKLIYDQGDKIIMQEMETGKTTALDITLPADYRFDPVERKVYTTALNEYSISPNEKWLAFIVRGEVFVKMNDKDKDNSKARRITQTAGREKFVQWLNDTVLLYASDRDGQYDIYVAQSADQKIPDLYKTLKINEEKIYSTHQDETSVVLSPDCKKIILVQGMGILKVADIGKNFKLENVKELKNDWSPPEDISWSPDGRWIAYSMPDLNFNNEIWIQRADNSEKAVNISLHPKFDIMPVWSADGKKLFFLSERNNADLDVWLLWLNKTDWEKTKADWKEDETGNTDKKDSVVVHIDFNQIHKRLVQVTSMPGNESALSVDKKGEYLYFSTQNSLRESYGADNEVDLYKIKWDGTDLKRITTGNSKPVAVQLSPKGDYIYFINSKSKQLQQLDVKTDKSEIFPFSATMDIHHQAEMEQIFNEACRIIDMWFYDPQFHKKNWEEIKKVYRPLCLQASTIHDFRRIYNDMLGQLNSSHMGLRGGENPEKLQKEITGELGIEVKPLKNGVEIVYVLKDSPADKKDIALKPGDVIYAVNGNEIKEGVNFYEFLAYTANEKCWLTIESEGNRKEVTVRPEADLTMVKYTDWVESRKELVKKQSNDKLGYIHIRGMGLLYFESFVTELTATAQDKDALIIDVRYNGGGWTTDYLMAVLTARQHAYTIPRGAASDLEKEHQKFSDYYPYGPRFPMAAWMKPSIALCNSNSYSNAEIFSHAFKTLEIGPLVGQPTFGAVISTGGYTLIDGSLVRMPFRAWYVKGSNLNMEGNPAVPDYEVINPPDYRNNKDLQLEKAIEVMLKNLNQ